MKLARFAVDRPVTLGMLTLSMVILGVISFTRLPLEQMPSISSSSVSVSVSYPSSSPEEVERAVTVPLEQSLAILSGVESLSSTSSANSASVRIEFEAGTDMDLATMEVRDRVDQVRGVLPPEIDRVTIRRWQTDERPILYARIAWRGQGEQLFDVVRKVIEPRLLRIAGVVNVTIDDMDDKQLIVRLDQQRLEAHDVSLAGLAAQVRDNNVDVSLGRVLDAGQRYQVRARGEFQRVEQIGDLPLARSSLKLSDLGQVSYDYPEKRRYERLNGVEALGVEVYKGSTDNVVEVAGRAHAVLDEIAAEYGDQLEVQVAEDRAETVLGELGNLRDTAFMGGFLAIAIIFLFLRSVRSTLVIAVAIPVSVACVFTGLYLARELFGSTVTLNMVSMMGLMLAVGMLVDPAVVTLESIFRRRQEEGLEPMAAAVSGAGEIGMAVLASSLTTMCVFIPFFFATQSRMTTWMRDAGLTICLAVAVSTVVSLTLIPLGASRIFREEYSRFDGVLRVLVGLLVAAAFGWKIHEIGWPATRRWLRVTAGRVGDSLAGMEWTTAAGLVVVMVAAAALAWRFHRHGMRSSYVSLLNWTLDHRAVAVGTAVMLIFLGNYLY
ncbi:MAG: efflux RND transporter permease subunit, partial [Gemmatimonadota bacterium]